MATESNISALSGRRADILSMEKPPKMFSEKIRKIDPEGCNAVEREWERYFKKLATGIAGLKSST